MYESVLQSFSVLTVCVHIAWQTEIGVKAACKMLVKLTPALKYKLEKMGPKERDEIIYQVLSIELICRAFMQYFSKGNSFNVPLYILEMWTC